MPTLTLPRYLHPSTHTPTNSFYYYLPVIAVCVVAFLFPSGRSSGQRKPKTESAAATTTTTSDHSTSNDAVVEDKKTV